MIKYVNVSKTYGDDNVVLDDININIKKGEFVFVIGHSGAGKSTLMKLLFKEEDPTSGRIFVAGQEITKVSNRLIPSIRRNIGMIFQDFRLLENKTVYDNVAYAMEILGERNIVIRREVPRILQLMGISAKAKSYPKELSGGEKQRVAIARAMVKNPPILMADEPTGNLDKATSDDIMALIERINRYGTTVIMATHDEGIVNKMQKRVIELRRGKVVKDEVGGYYNAN
ncbi:MAG: cell division ATP-binding protein FtsE [Bacillota bacterium]|nr:cell division ATP-binding protein FtsE [Bacillota bacterium]